MDQSFRDRKQAGQVLANKLAGLELVDPVVLALPRGGVPVAAEIARRLHAPLDLLLVKKIGAPGHSEYAVGAVSEDDQPVLNRKAIAKYRFPEKKIMAIADQKILEVRAQLKKFRGERPAVDVGGRPVIIVDDGVATGLTLKAALRLIKKRNPAKVILAIPVGPLEIVTELAGLVDLVVCPLRPELFFSVGAWYQDFSEVTDEDVVAYFVGLSSNSRHNEHRSYYRFNGRESIGTG